MNVTMPLVCVLLMILGLSEGFYSASNPGFRAIITQKALDYVSEIAGPLLKAEIKSQKLPPYTTTFKLLFVTFNFTAYNAVFDSIDLGNLSLSSTTGGLTMIGNGISLVIAADWTAKTISTSNNTIGKVDEAKKYHGTVTGSGSGISLKTTLDITMNRTTGGVHLQCTSCSISIDTVKVTVHGLPSILEKLTDLLQPILKQLIIDNACKYLKKEINTTLNEKLDQIISVTYQFKLFGKSVEVDYGLVSDPDFSHPDIVIINGKGEFRIANSSQDPPFPPPPLPDISQKNLSKMFYIQATTYVAESASWALWKAGIIQYNVSNDQIPEGFKTTGFYCDIVAPSLCTKYPSKKVMFGMTAVDYPRVNITPQYAVMTGKAHISMYVDNGGREEVAFTLLLNAQANLNLTLNQSSVNDQTAICGNVSNPKIDVTLASSNIGQFNCSSLKNIIITLAPTLGLAIINSELNKGIPIPEIDGFSFIDPTLTFGKGYAEVSGNVKGKPKL